jgi:hypothetical protein
LSSCDVCSFIAKLADRHNAVLGGEVGQHVEHRFGDGLVVGRLRVKADAAIVANAELTGAKLLESENGGQIIDIGA